MIIAQTTINYDWLEVENATYNSELKSANEVGLSEYSTITETITTSINEKLGFMLNIYPNPAIDHVVIESEDKINELVLINSLGEELTIDFSVRDANKVIMNTSNLGEGVYFIGISTNNSWVMKKLVINK